ncbi:MAG: Cof-type HAD-IIB family hydrolase [Terriglobales bacterium]
MTLPVRLLAIDIDGTLLDSRFQVPKANLEALHRAHALGVEVVLTTGRRHDFALPIAESLGFDLWLISSNGAVTKSFTGQLFHRDLLPAAVARRLIRDMGEYRPNTVLTFDREGQGALVIECADELNASIARWMEKNAQFLQQVVPLEEAVTEDPVQVMFCGSIERMKAAEARIAAGDCFSETTVLKTQYEVRNLCILDVLNRDCSKGHALKRWAEWRGYSREEVMAIGDNYNDVEMLAFAGLPFIMGNACPELKMNGWPETLGNDQGGVAAALQQVGI